MEGPYTIEAVQDVIYDDGHVEGDVPPANEDENKDREMCDVTIDVRKESQRNSRWRRFLRKFICCCCFKRQSGIRFRKPLCDPDPWFGSTPNFFKKTGRAVTFQTKPTPTPVSRAWKENLGNPIPDCPPLPSLQGEFMDSLQEVPLYEPSQDPYT
ncbi:hypothetical protein Pmani_034517 [Petrolisthes manimaculis]|uniref:Uncharacterized protein n=1 Tax=Petrolisthes manimaculis TaxID=1843537 RepID=A0AAE1NJ05_9EUCA|nr:hypothetical protein Pmani_036842 [Petrolisthes manimaculis]KAK4292731.1 hypothetical protein Pmani_034517 [Petrolisthes manimaculis]